MSSAPEPDDTAASNAATATGTTTSTATARDTATASAATTATSHDIPPVPVPELETSLPTTEHRSLYDAHIRQLPELQAQTSNPLEITQLPPPPSQQTEPPTDNTSKQAEGTKEDINKQAGIIDLPPVPPTSSYGTSAGDEALAQPFLGSLPMPVLPNYSLDSVSSKQPGEFILPQQNEASHFYFPFAQVEQKVLALPNSETAPGLPHSPSGLGKPPVYPMACNTLLSYHPKMSPGLLASYPPPVSNWNQPYTHAHAPPPPPPSSSTQHANWFMKQEQHLAGASHDQRAGEPAPFAPPQLDMQHPLLQPHPFPGVGTSQLHPPQIPSFGVISSSSADGRLQNESHKLPTGLKREEMPYKPLLPRTEPFLLSTSQYSKPPVLGSAFGASSAENDSKKHPSDKPVPTIRKYPRLGVQYNIPITSQNPPEATPSTLVTDAYASSGSAGAGPSNAPNPNANNADIDSSLIDRLRWFSQNQPTMQQTLPSLPPSSRTASLAPALFPNNFDQHRFDTHPRLVLMHDPYLIQSSIQRGKVEPQLEDGGSLYAQKHVGLLPGTGMPGVRVQGQGIAGAGSAAMGAMGAMDVGASIERPFKCKYCNASFGRRDNMQKHERTIHMGERPFVCHICSYAFQKKDHRDKHIRTVHLKERPYQCTLCESRFGQKSDLTKHIRTVHQRIKPFKCEQCGLSFGHRGNKLRHVFVVHQKRKPHVCNICNQAFGERSNLAKHSLAVHKMPIN